MVGRKGVYTDLAKWARGKGYPMLRVDGRFLPTQGFPRIDRYIEHNIELPVADLTITPEAETELRTHLLTTCSTARAWSCCSKTWTGCSRTSTPP